MQHVANTCLLACKVNKKTGNRFDDFNQNFDKINQNERKTHFFRRILQKNQKIPPDFGKKAARDDLCEIVYQCLKKRGCAYFDTPSFI